MKRLFLLIFMFMGLSISFASCSENHLSLDPESEQPIVPDKGDEAGENLKITVGSVSFRISLADNAATKAFKALLPMTVKMSEMGGNEKYYYLPESLPMSSFSPGAVREGDLMLYGSSCVVLFYEAFSTSYRYTRLGRVENPSGLASALGLGSVNVIFELQ